MLKNGLKNNLILPIFILAIDQIQKTLMVNHFKSNPEVIEVTSFFNFVMVWNNGVSFGMFHNFEYSKILFIILSLIIVGILMILMTKSENKLQTISLGLIIGGALGNVIDRLNYGAVADFFDFHIDNWHYPAFNLADSFIVIGAVLLILDSLFSKKNGPPPEAQRA